MKKWIKWFSTFWKGLFIGMKTTEDTMFKGSTDIIPGTAVIQEVSDKRVSKDLLKGEVTQAVEELRYRTYKVDREAKQFEYIAPTLAFRREKQDSKFVSYDNSDELEVITIQTNEAIVEDVAESLKYVGGHGKRSEYVIKIQRDFYPRYRIEEYTKRLVVKKLDETHAILDFYVSKYPNDKDFKSKGFVREIEKIKDEKMHSDVVDVERVSFVTSHAFKLDDMMAFEFDNVWFKEVVEFDGHYVIRFKSRVVKNGIDLTEQYYSKSMDEKYKNKTKKDVVVDILGSIPPQIYKCEKCGKEIVYDPEEMNEAEIYQPRDIDEVIENYDSVTDYMDAQISQQTYGIVMCKDCLRKYLEENNLI